MKIAFDENVPLGMVRVFQALAKERQLRRAMGQFEIVSAGDYAPDVSDVDYVRNSDAPWVVRFAADSGRVIVSGDQRMLQRPHELLALQQCGFVVIFFESQWCEWDFFRKCSLLLHYWPAIAKKVKTAKAGTFLRVPINWKVDGELREIAPPKGKISKRLPSAGGRQSDGKTEALSGQGGSVETAKKGSPKKPVRRSKDGRQGELNLDPPTRSDGPKL